MTYVYIIAFVGTIVALGAGVWYYIKKAGGAEDANATLSSDNQAKDTKIKTLDDRIVDSEYARRAAEKKTNAQIANDHDAAAAVRLLEGAGHDDKTN